MTITAARYLAMVTIKIINIGSFYMKIDAAECCKQIIGQFHAKIRWHFLLSRINGKVYKWQKYSSQFSSMWYKEKCMDNLHREWPDSEKVVYNRQYIFIHFSCSRHFSILFTLIYKVDGGYSFFMQHFFSLSSLSLSLFRSFSPSLTLFSSHFWCNYAERKRRATKIKCISVDTFCA